MKDIIQEIKALISQYPDKLKSYDPIDAKSIEIYTNNLGFELDSDLKEIYLFSNGVSFFDYCLRGLGNKELGDLKIDPYLNFESSRVIVILATSGYHEFGYLLDAEDNDHKVVMIEPVNHDMVIVSNSIKEFFHKFLAKLEIMMKLSSPDEVVIYLDDDSLPENLNEW